MDRQGDESTANADHNTDEPNDEGPSSTAVNEESQTIYGLPPPSNKPVYPVMPTRYIPPRGNTNPLLRRRALLSRQGTDQQQRRVQPRLTIARPPDQPKSAIVEPEPTEPEPSTEPESEPNSFNQHRKPHDDDESEKRSENDAALEKSSEPVEQETKPENEAKTNENGKLLEEGESMEELSKNLRKAFISQYMEQKYQERLKMQPEPIKDHYVTVKVIEQETRSQHQVRSHAAVEAMLLIQDRQQRYNENHQLREQVHFMDMHAEREITRLRAMNRRRKINQLYEAPRKPQRNARLPSSSSFRQVFEDEDSITWRHYRVLFDEWAEEFRQDLLDMELEPEVLDFLESIFDPERVTFPPLPIAAHLPDNTRLGIPSSIPIAPKVLRYLKNKHMLLQKELHAFYPPVKGNGHSQNHQLRGFKNSELYSQWRKAYRPDIEVSDTATDVHKFLEKIFDINWVANTKEIEAQRAAEAEAQPGPSTGALTSQHWREPCVEVTSASRPKGDFLSMNELDAIGVPISGLRGAGTRRNRPLRLSRAAPQPLRAHPDLQGSAEDELGNEQQDDEEEGPSGSSQPKKKHHPKKKGKKNRKK
ncbi:unnamed protein product [Caenorhabditis bovis]|uniref:Uncharacterized protein n=1 Tax=Caenorhabditis bovis TaxID=2654633 RepID=A0A8S1FDW0_9PELO|nr:unnamed protein product [Caenorhabditis bovis]